MSSAKSNPPRTQEAGIDPRDEAERVQWLSRALDALNQRPGTLERLQSALRSDDVKGFTSTLMGHWGEFDLQPPADKCDPYVTGYLFVLKEPEFVYVCTWVGPAQIQAPDTETYQASGTAAQVLDWLVKKGYFECAWVLKNQSELVVLKKFVQGICPPGTF
jgi:hypothetical protein